MITFQPGFQKRAVLAQATLPTAPATPGAAPVPEAPAMAPAAPKALGGFLDTLKWAAIGFGAGALTGFALGKGGLGAQGKGSDVTNGVLGGLGGVAASILPGLLGLK